MLLNIDSLKFLHEPLITYPLEPPNSLRETESTVDRIPPMRIRIGR